MQHYLLISLGAVLGANARYLVGTWVASRFGTAFPYGTLLVNITGSLLLGFLVALSSSRLDIPANLRLFLTVGFLGSYTTFSSFTVESVLLLQDSGLWHSLLNIIGNNLVGLVCALLGVYLAQMIGYRMN